MHKIFNLKTILTTVISASVATSFIVLPVKKSEANLVDKTTNTELNLSQNFDYSTPQNGSFQDRPNNDLPTDNFKNVVGITGLAIGTGFIGWHLTKTYKPSLVNSLPTLNNSKISLLDRVNPKLRRELLRLVHNRQTASRLLSGTLTSHPGRSPNWLAEKVIYDLERDR